MKPSDDRFHEVFNLVEPFIERRYGIPVHIADVTNPFTGDLDGAAIQVDYEQNIEEAVFILVHLFGHTVQWNINERSRAIGNVTPGNVSAAELAEIDTYERDACAYGLQLFHEAGVRDLDQWISDYAACDYAYLAHFYRTGAKLEFRSFWCDGQPLVAPLKIPHFHPTQWVSRWKGTVI